MTQMAKVHKFHPQTKYLNGKLHHFHSSIEWKEVSIHPIKSKEQVANYFTKPLNVDQL